MAFAPKRKPAFRKLKAYAFDPSLSLHLDTADINEMVYLLPWEDLEPGPKGEYLEIVDYDPTIGKFYQAVDLNEPYILVEDGIRPSESNPLFHQQMVYAVAMYTIRNFEKALGRKVLWSTRLLENRDKYESYVGQLRIYPHAFRDANAYYSPLKKAVLFGYFKARPASGSLHMPDALVFTCLSHDIIAHEVTHAILDGMHRNYNQPTNPDVLAFHEAFADIVALFQHFTFPQVLKHQIAKTRGQLENQNLLGKLAQEFGSAIGGYGSLRDAIGKINDKTGEWEPRKPNPTDYERTVEPHARGSILVAAVFDAFLSIYKRRVADLLRISTNGTGILPEGAIHPDLVDRMAKEASKSAGHILNMCIRALDYCPPVDITFGDYLRAIITADVDLVQNDDKEYRLAFIDAFRKRGIYPKGIKTLSIDSLRMEETNIVLESFIKQQNKDLPKNVLSALKIKPETKLYLRVLQEFLKDYGNTVKYIKSREAIYDKTRAFIGGNYDETEGFIKGLHQRIAEGLGPMALNTGSDDFSALTGLVFKDQFKQFGIKSSSDGKLPSFQIQNLRLISRVGPDGNLLNEVVFSIIQKTGVIFENGQFIGHFTPGEDIPENGFILYGGCTLIFDMDEDKLKYAISKPLINQEKLIIQGLYEMDMERIKRQYHFQRDEGLAFRNAFQQYFGMGLDHQYDEPFAFLHQH